MPVKVMAASSSPAAWWAPVFPRKRSTTSSPCYGHWLRTRPPFPPAVFLFPAAVFASPAVVFLLPVTVFPSPAAILLFPAAIFPPPAARPGKQVPANRGSIGSGRNSSVKWNTWNSPPPVSSGIHSTAGSARKPPRPPAVCPGNKGQTKPEKTFYPLPGRDFASRDSGGENVYHHHRNPYHQRTPVNPEKPG